MKIEPLHNQVAIRQKEESERMYGSIIVPDAGKEKPLLGEVVAIGPGLLNQDLQRVPMSVAVGDIVAFPAFGGVRISIDSEEFIISRDSDLLAIIKD